MQYRTVTDGFPANDAVSTDNDDVADGFQDDELLHDEQASEETEGIVQHEQSRQTTDPASHVDEDRDLTSSDDTVSAANDDIFNDQS
jgi:hypothetical protein